MRFLLTPILFLLASTINGQAVYNQFRWEDAPVLHTIDKEYANEAAVYVIDERINEYCIEKSGFFMYRTMHKIVHINNDKGIESFNRIYLPFDEGVEMMDVKARTILPGGKIIEMDKNNIKDWKEDNNVYKIFALEGLTKGCEVEYYFTLKKNPSFFGREILSSRIPAMRTHFNLISPEHLIFETKSFNDLPNSKEVVKNEKRYLVIEDNKLNGAEEEKYSMYQAGLKRVEYKLSYNKGRNPQDRLYTWNECAKKVYDIYTSIDDKEYKKVNALLETIKPNGSEIEKIIAIENYLKKNFICRENIPDDDMGDLGKVIKNKIASQKAMIKIYAGLFTSAGIPFQIVLTGDREDYSIDKNFENWNNTKHFLLYFPSIKKFIAPTEVEYRYPWIPPTWTATNGLFCVGTTIGNFTTAIGEIRPIPMEDVERSFVNMDVDLKLDQDESMILNVKHTYGGYAAVNYRLPFVFLPAEDQNKVLKDMIKFGTNSENILSHSFENKELEQADPYKPFVINASVKSTNLTENAGEKIIVKIGEVIGEQVEMYQTKPRAFDIDINYPHALIRNIRFTVPDGYTVKNLSDLNINEVYKENDKELMGFVSSYTLSGNSLIIIIKENYNRVTYAKSLYEAYKKVINAAADFNKVVLVLEKTK